MQGFFRALGLGLTAVVLGACSSGNGGESGLLDPNNPPINPASIQLALTCPSNIAAGQTKGGFLATVTDNKDQPVKDAALSITATTGEITITPPAGSTDNPPRSNTNRFGELGWSLTVPADTPPNTEITVRVRADFSGATVTKSCRLNEASPNFAITAPTDGSTFVTGGTPEAVDLSWVDLRARGVVGNVRFTTTAAGRLSATPTGPFNTQITGMTDSNGRLSGSTPVFFSCARAGNITLDAADVGGTNASSITVTCLDAPGSIQLVASALTVAPKPSTDSRSTLTATVFDSRGRVMVDAPVSFELTGGPNGGETLSPSARVTDEDGVAESLFQAGTVPGTVSLRACVRGTSVCQSESIVIANSASGGSTAPAMALTCPSSMARTTRSTAFLVKVTNGSAPAAGVIVGFTADRGRIDAPPDQTGTFTGSTNAAGELPFALQLSATDEAGTVSIRASANVGSMTVARSCTVNVIADNFQLTSPVMDSSQGLGTDNTQAIAFRWTRSDGTPVASSRVRLSTDNGGQVLFNGSSGTSSVEVTTDTNGNFPSSPALSLLCTNSGLVNLRAEDSVSNARSSVVRVQCVDPPALVRVTASPTAVSRAPSDSRFSDISAQPVGASGQNLRNTDVVFTLLSSPSSADRVLISQGNSGSGGPVVSRFEAGAAPGVARVQACVKGTTTCEVVSITIN